jgi:surface protein
MTKILTSFLYFFNHRNRCDVRSHILISVNSDRFFYFIRQTRSVVMLFTMIKILLVVFSIILVKAQDNKCRRHGHTYVPCLNGHGTTVHGLVLFQGCKEHCAIHPHDTHAYICGPCPLNRRHCFHSDVDLREKLKLYFKNDRAVRSTYGESLGTWCVKNVKNFSSLFQDNIEFDEDISGWDVSHATDMSYMFANATSFYQDLSRWKVSSVCFIRHLRLTTLWDHGTCVESQICQVCLLSHIILIKIYLRGMFHRLTL